MLTVVGSNLTHATEGETARRTAIVGLVRKDAATLSARLSLSRRRFCLCCMAGAASAATRGWLTPRQVFAEARGLVSLIKDSAAVSPIVTHRLPNNIAVLQGSGGNITVLTSPDGKVLIDAGIGVSRPQITKALAELGSDPITHLVNTHW